MASPQGIIVLERISDFAEELGFLLCEFLVGEDALLMKGGQFFENLHGSGGYNADENRLVASAVCGKQLIRKDEEEIHHGPDSNGVHQ